jgi:hypothetical protein
MPALSPDSQSASNATLPISEQSRKRVLESTSGNEPKNERRHKRCKQDTLSPAAANKFNEARRTSPERNGRVIKPEAATTLKSCNNKPQHGSTMNPRSNNEQPHRHIQQRQETVAKPKRGPTGNSSQPICRGSVSPTASTTSTNVTSAAEAVSGQNVQDDKDDDDQDEDPPKNQNRWSIRGVLLKVMVAISIYAGVSHISTTTSVSDVTVATTTAPALNFHIFLGEGPVRVDAALREFLNQYSSFHGYNFSMEGALNGLFETSRGGTMLHLWNASHDKSDTNIVSQSTGMIKALLPVAPTSGHRSFDQCVMVTLQTVSDLAKGMQPEQRTVRNWKTLFQNALSDKEMRTNYPKDYPSYMFKPMIWVDDKSKDQHIFINTNDDASTLSSSTEPSTAMSTDLSISQRDDAKVLSISIRTCGTRQPLRRVKNAFKASADKLKAKVHHVGTGVGNVAKKIGGGVKKASGNTKKTLGTIGKRFQNWSKSQKWL